MANWIGEDSSGQGNNFLINSLATYDIIPDTPTNNFATWNPIDTGPSSLSQGNLRVQTTNHNDTSGTFKFPSTGKWYYEIYFITRGSSYMGIIPIRYTNNEGTWDTSALAFRADNGNKYSYHSGGWQSESYGSAFSNGDILQVAVDMDNGKLWFGDSGTWIASGDPGAGSNQVFTFTASLGWKPFIYGPGSSNATDAIVNFGQTGTFVGYVTAGSNADGNGYGNFKYSVPSGFLSLCAANIPDPTIVKGTDYFNTVIYTGNGSTQSISGVGFQPDLVWIKNRSAQDDHKLTDAVRGATNEVESNTDTAGAANADGLTSFASDGFALGDDDEYNTNTENYVSWNWKAAGVPTADNTASAGATPTAGSVKIDGVNLGSALAGSIAATRLTANTTAGFSIVTYPGGAGTVAHGLGVAPKIVLQKKHDSSGDWLSYTSAVDGTADAIRLNTNDSVVAADPETLATSTVFSSLIGGNNTIAYCFAEVVGYSAFGTYTGDASTAGPFIHTGFRPALIIAKRTDATDDWEILDSVRNTYNDGANCALWPGGNGTTGWDESCHANYAVDFVSNGFKLRTSHAVLNASGGTYMYMALAESPFKYSTAR